MKSLLFMATFFLSVHFSFAQSNYQPLPSSTFMTPYALQIGYNTTTILIFPSNLKPGDKGKSDKEFIVQKQPGTDSVLKLKAARKDFTPSNLHVFTSDGKIYCFLVSYAENPDHIAFDLTKLSSSNEPLSRTGDINSSNLPVNPESFRFFSNEIKTAKPFFSRAGSNFLMKLKLRSIYSVGQLIFFEISAKNNSDLDYPVDFFRMYIEDLHKAKKTSIQQTEILPLFKDAPTTIPAHQTIKYIFAVPRFTIPEKKQFVFEMYEQNGGRNISLSVKNRQLFKARPLSTISHGK